LVALHMASGSDQGGEPARGRELPLDRTSGRSYQWSHQGVMTTWGRDLPRYPTNRISYRWSHQGVVTTWGRDNKGAVPLGEGYALLLSFFRMFSLRMIFRILRLSGVTSRYSSRSMYSMNCSRDISTGGASLALSSDPEARMLVSFLVLVTLTTRSFSRLCSPTICPSYTSAPGETKKCPRSCNLSIA